MKTSKPKPPLGQHFLVDLAVIEKTIEVADLPQDATVVEIGAGKGVLTEALGLAVSNGLVLALEIDYQLIEPLRKKFKNRKNIKIIHADGLGFLQELLAKADQPICVVANLPYQITAPVIHLVEQLIVKKLCLKAVLLVQKEVAEKLTAPAGSRARTKQTVFLEAVAKTNIIIEVPPEAFDPPPKINSALAVIDPKIDTEPIGKLFAGVVKAGFSAKRRTLVNSLSGSLGLPKKVVSDILESVGVQPSRRAETLTVNEWREVAREIEKKIANNR